MCSVSTPKEVWLQLLHTSSRPLSHAMLHKAAEDTNTLNAEYQVPSHSLPVRFLDVGRCVRSGLMFFMSLFPPQKIPPNFVSAAELDVPGHMIKDRYKTILPSQSSRRAQQNNSENVVFPPVRPVHHVVVYSLDPESRVVLRSPEEEAAPDRYINANYIRVRTRLYF